MQRLRTFIHQKRFLQKQGSAAGHSHSTEQTKYADDWDGTIDHRLVEDHRLKWRKRFDAVCYFLAAAIILYTLYQWWSG